MTKRSVTKLVQLGEYIAEVDIEMIYTDDDWSPYLSVDEAMKMDDVREALRRKDFETAKKLSRVFTLSPLVTLNPTHNLMQLQDFIPQPSLITRVTTIQRAHFPLIDAHDHLGDEFGRWTERPLSELLDLLDQAGVEIFVDLDGGWGEDLFHSHLDTFKQPAPQRFKIFTGVNWKAWPEQGDRFGEWAAQKLREHARQGADGLKVWKDFGLHVRDQHGRRVAVEDPRLDPLWSAAGELGLPVTWHTADPVAFFNPLDAHNERWEELQAHPDWHFPSPAFPSFLSLVEGMAEVVSRHPNTTFIGAHVGCYAENLGWVAALLERCPNFFIDISARTAELGRQPYTARRFFIQYADRILYGTDAGPNLLAYRLLVRFLETDDEYFNYDTAVRPPQGRWQVYGLYLPNDVLEKIYYRNAARIMNQGQDTNGPN